MLKQLLNLCKEHKEESLYYHCLFPVFNDVKIKSHRDKKKKIMVDTYTGILFSLQLKEILQYVIPWVNLEDITLCEMSQSQTDRCYMTLFIRDTGNGQIKVGSRMVAARALRDTRMGNY